MIFRFSKKVVVSVDIKDIGELEEGIKIIEEMRNVCIYMENCSIKTMPVSVFVVFEIVLKEIILLLEECQVRFENTDDLINSKTRKEA